jgi:DNA repair exonuclease SbcCD ATPase subunit
MIAKTVITTKSDFMEHLTHDSFLVQIPRITDRFQTRLDRFLSLFEQSGFTDDRRISKRFNHPADNDGDLKTALDILHYVCVEPEERRQIEDEQEAWRTFDVMYGKKLNDAMQEKNKEVQEAKKALQEKDKEVQETKKAMQETKKAMQETKKAMQEKDREMDALRKQLEELQRKATGNE